MPKFYRQNKKRIDPRYFLDETTNRDIEESSVSPFEETLPKEKTQMPRDSKQDLGVFDGELEDGTPIVKVLNDVRKQLNIPGGQSVLNKFDQLLAELGVDLGSAPVPGQDSDVPESEAEKRTSGRAPTLDQDINRMYYDQDHHPNNDKRW